MATVINPSTSSSSSSSKFRTHDQLDQESAPGFQFNPTISQTLPSKRTARETFGTTPRPSESHKLQSQLGRDLKKIRRLDWGTTHNELDPLEGLPPLQTSASTSYISQDPYFPVFNLPRPQPLNLKESIMSVLASDEFELVEKPPSTIKDFQTPSSSLGDLISQDESFTENQNQEKIDWPIDGPLTKFISPFPNHSGPNPKKPLKRSPSLLSQNSFTLSLIDQIHEPTNHWKNIFNYFINTVFINNMFFPFMNGMLIGFGEIAIKEYFINYLGWKPRSKSLKSTELLIDSSAKSHSN